MIDDVGIFRTMVGVAHVTRPAERRELTDVVRARLKKQVRPLVIRSR